jgi:hypothetical protein
MMNYLGQYSALEVGLQVNRRASSKPSMSWLLKWAKYSHKQELLPPVCLLQLPKRGNR